MIRRTASAAVVVLLAAYSAPAAEKELHVVVAKHGGAPWDEKMATATVRVDRPGKEVVLLVAGGEYVEWDVSATPKTKLAKVIVGGVFRQRVRAPEGVTVEERFNAGAMRRMTPVLSPAYDLDTDASRRFVFAVTEDTKLEIASFQGAYLFDPAKPFVVDEVQKPDERLRPDFPRVVPLAERPKLKFSAARIVIDDRGAKWDCRYGEWTETGPTAGTLVKLPDGISRVAFDAGAKRYFGLGTFDLFAVDVARGTSEKIEPPEEKFRWPRALTFDAKRGRLIVTADGGLFEYAKKAQKWTRLTDAEFSFYAALAWQAKSDTLYAFGIEWSREQGGPRTPTLYALRADGTIAKQTALGSPVFPYILGDTGRSGIAELVDLGAELALVVHRRNERGDRGERETLLYVIDPKTGKTKLAWKE